MYIVSCPTCGAEVSFVRLGSLRFPDTPRTVDDIKTCRNGHSFLWEYPGPGTPLPDKPSPFDFTCDEGTALCAGTSPDDALRRFNAVPTSTRWAWLSPHVTPERLVAVANLPPEERLRVIADLRRDHEPVGDA